MEEIWAEVVGYPQYIVSNYGVVVNVETDQPLSPRYHRQSGTYRVALYRDGQREDVYVHHLVAQAFFDNYRPGMHVQHVNGNKKNSSTRNLRLRGRVVPRDRRDGEREPWGKRVMIRETGEVFRTVRECARHIGGDYSSIYDVLRGERKHHLGFTFEYYEGKHYE